MFLPSQPGSRALQGVGRTPGWMYRKSYWGNMKPAISHRAQLLPALQEHRELCSTGREPPQRSRQEEDPTPGRAGWLVGFRPGSDHWAVFHFKDQTLAPTPAPLFLLGQKLFFANVSVLSPFSQPWMASLYRKQHFSSKPAGPG